MTSVYAGCQHGVVNSKAEESQLEILLKASQLFYSGNYEELYQVIVQNHFNEKSRKQMQTYWLKAHYFEAEKTRGKPLGPVEKYRIRKKFPIPETIWDETNKSHCFQENIRQYLHHQYLKDPYPTSNKKREMSGATGLSIVQVSNWFKNRRQRDRAAIGKTREVTKSNDNNINMDTEESSFQMSVDNISQINISNKSRFKGFSIADLCIENDNNKKDSSIIRNSIIYDNISLLNMHLYFNYNFFNTVYKNCK